MIENVCNYPKTLRISIYHSDTRDEVACTGHHHTDLVPSAATTGLMEDCQNNSATFKVCPEIKRLSLLSVSGLTPLKKDTHSVFI